MQFVGEGLSQLILPAPREGVRERGGGRDLLLPSHLADQNFLVHVLVPPPILGPVVQACGSLLPTGFRRSFPARHPLMSFGA